VLTCYVPNIDVFCFLCLGGFTRSNQKFAIKQVDKGKYHRNTSDEALTSETSVSQYFYDVLWKSDPYQLVWKQIFLFHITDSLATKNFIDTPQCYAKTSFIYRKCHITKAAPSLQLNVSNPLEKMVRHRLDQVSSHREVYDNLTMPIVCSKELRLLLLELLLLFLQLLPRWQLQQTTTTAAAIINATFTATTTTTIGTHWWCYCSCCSFYYWYCFYYYCCCCYCYF